MTRLVVVAMAVASLVFSHGTAGDGWKHLSVERERGSTEATLSYETRRDPSFALPYKAVDYARMRLVVRRSGQTVIDRLFSPTFSKSLSGWPAADVTLQLRDVWGSALPEAVVEIGTGGNTCCADVEVGLVSKDGIGRVLFHDFGMGWRGKRYDAGFYFVSGDYRFYCAFSDCASASMPVQLFAIDKAGRQFTDVTRTRRDLVSADAVTQWKYYLGARHGQYDPSGLLAPWCGDEYLLGREAACHHVLEQALARGELTRPATPKHFIAYLERKFAAWGYG